MIYPNVYQGPSIGVKTVDDMNRQRQQDYWVQQARLDQERKAGEQKVLAPVIGQSGLIENYVRIGKSDYERVPQSGISQFANRMAIKSQIATSATTGIMPTQQQVQRAGTQQRKQEPEPEPDNGLAEEVARLGEMVLALGKGVADVLKQSARQGQKEQPGEEIREEPEKAGYFDPDFYVVTGFSHVAGQSKKNVMGKVKNNPGIAKGGVEIFKRVGPNAFEPITRMLPVSPITGQPSSLRQLALSKVGLTQKSGHMPTKLEDCSSIIPGEICEVLETETKRREQSPANLKSDALRRSNLVL